ncbi:LysE family translocator [Pseudoteredinibacter isoporae]|uniref:LysE family translocator n=1 Tax=Pseudoteredinibacter isoporae TaxID=570281 RepID=UPI003104513E
MDIVNLITFITVASLLVMSPGPNGVLIAKTVPTSGHRAGFANTWGFVAAFYVHGTLSIFGISIILVQSAHAFLIFKTLGAAYLIWIGIKALKEAIPQPAATPSVPHATHKAETSVPSAFAEGFLTNVLNPKVSMFYLAAFPQFLAPGENASHAYFLVSAHAALNLIWFSLMVLLLARVNTLTKSPNFTRWLKSVTGVVFIGFGAKLALLRPLNNN